METHEIIPKGVLILCILIAVTKIKIYLCRKTTEKMLHDLLVCDNIGPTLVPYIVPCLALVYSDNDILINRVAETISDIREPIATTETMLSGQARRDYDKKVLPIK